MTRKPKTTAFWVGRLPHWEVEDGRYFVTIHLAGAIPQMGRNRIREISNELVTVKDKNTVEWLRLQRKIFGEMEHWLDRCEWNALLKDADVANMVVEALEHRRKRGMWNLFEYVVMPTHIHFFCEVLQGTLKESIEDFKRWTGHQAAKLIKFNGDRFWQREWFDHWSRSDEEDERIIRYIRENPVKAGLVQHAIA